MEAQETVRTCEQEVIPPGTRDNAGRFAKGASGNPKGAGKQPYQYYGVRSQYWLEKLTLGQIKQIVADPGQLDNYSCWDAIVLKHIANTMSGPDQRAERKDLLDRIEGQPKQIIAHSMEQEEVPESNESLANAQNIYHQITRE